MCARKYARCVNSFSSYFGNQGSTSSPHHFGIQAVLCATNKFRMSRHRCHDSLTSRAGGSVKSCRRRDETRVHQGHCFHCDAKNRNATPVNSDRKSTRLNSSHLVISYAVFCLKKKKK